MVSPVLDLEVGPCLSYAIRTPNIFRESENLPMHGPRFPLNTVSRRLSRKLVFQVYDETCAQQKEAQQRRKWEGKPNCCFVWLERHRSVRFETATRGPHSYSHWMLPPDRVKSLNSGPSRNTRRLNMNGLPLCCGFNIHSALGSDSAFVSVALVEQSISWCFSNYGSMM